MSQKINQKCMQCVIVAMANHTIARINNAYKWDAAFAVLVDKLE